MSEIKLLPCPFCGGEAEIRKYDKKDIHGYVIGKQYAIGCKDNDLQCAVVPETCVSRKVDDVIRIWNNRKPIDDMIEQLKNATFLTAQNVESIYIGRAIDIVRGGRE